MAIQLSSLNTITLDNTLVTGQIIDATEHNTHRALVENPINNYLTALRDNEANYPGTSAPADTPAGKLWMNTSDTTLRLIETLGGTGKPIALKDATGYNLLLGAPTYPTVPTSMAKGILIPAGTAPAAAPAAGVIAGYSLATDAFGVAKSDFNIQNEAQTIWRLGGGANKSIAGVGVDLASYVSATGTAGTDNTSQTVKSITLKANSLNAVGRGIRVRAIATSSSASALQISLTLNSVGLITASISASGKQVIIDTVIYYIDATHINVHSFSAINGTVSADANNTSNLGGFVLTSDQTLAVTQNNVAATHATVFSLFVEQLG